MTSVTEHGDESGHGTLDDRGHGSLLLEGSWITAIAVFMEHCDEGCHGGS